MYCEDICPTFSDADVRLGRLTAKLNSTNREIYWHICYGGNSNNLPSVLIDPSPMPASVPHVDEVGASSAPLKSASFFIGAKCAPYNDDYMLCRAENGGKSEEPCLAAGRKVTRCTSDVLNSIQSACLETFTTHWQCLESQNQDFKNCRPAERALNKCVFEKMVCTLHPPLSHISRRRM